jgi:4-hydroxy-3-polyprenylbenzoate decarboxylase
LPNYILAITGASGAAYGQRLARFFEEQKLGAYIIFSDHSRIVIKQELGIALQGVKTRDLASRFIGKKSRYLVPLDFRDMTAPAASGSARIKGMIVAPCSMATLSALAHGSANTLIARAADVMIKERRPLALVPRETPLSGIHLMNMLLLSLNGVQIVAAMPAFYHRPKRIEEMVDFIAGRALDFIGIEHKLYKKWKG